jgi:hypothetical protein
LFFSRSDQQQGERIMSENIVSEATWNWTRAANDTSKALANTAVAAQERSMRYAQSMFENGIEVVKSHTQETHALTQTLVEQSQKQQEAFQTLVHEATEAYTGFFSTMFSYYRQVYENAGAAVWQSVDTAQKVTREGMNVAQEAMRQGQKVAR